MKKAEREREREREYIGSKSGVIIRELLDSAMPSPNSAVVGS